LGIRVIWFKSRLFCVRILVLLMQLPSISYDEYPFFSNKVTLLRLLHEPVFGRKWFRNLNCTTFLRQSCNPQCEPCLTDSHECLIPYNYIHLFTSPYATLKIQRHNYSFARHFTSRHIAVSLFRHSWFRVRCFCFGFYRRLV